jgi:hypothetical protein
MVNLKDFQRLVEMEGIGTHEFAVLAVLCWHYNSGEAAGGERGQCNPGIELVAKEAKMNEKTVRRKLDSLEERGMLHRKLVPSGRGNASYWYWLTFLYGDPPDGWMPYEMPAHGERRQMRSPGWLEQAMEIEGTEPTGGTEGSKPTGDSGQVQHPQRAQSPQRAGLKSTESAPKVHRERAQSPGNRTTEQDEGTGKVNRTTEPPVAASPSAVGQPFSNKSKTQSPAKRERGGSLGVATFRSKCHARCGGWIEVGMPIWITGSPNKRYSCHAECKQRLHDLLDRMAAEAADMPPAYGREAPEYTAPFVPLETPPPAAEEEEDNAPEPTGEEGDPEDNLLTRKAGQIWELISKVLRGSNRNAPKLGEIHDLCQKHGWENVLRLVEHHPQAFRLVSMHNDTVGEWMGRMLEG